MNKPVIFLDFDGCIASQGKIRGDQDLEGHFSKREKRLTCSKVISDHDSWALDTLKEHAHIAIISGDKNVNDLWAKHRGIPFIFTSAAGFHGDKWQHLQDYWQENFRLKGDPKGNYFYLGDSMPDYKCMLNSNQAFMPADACKVLKRLNDDNSHGFINLRTESGKGCFEEMALQLVDMNVLRMKFLAGDK